MHTIITESISRSSVLQAFTEYNLSLAFWGTPKLTTEMVTGEPKLGFPQIAIITRDLSDGFLML